MATSTISNTITGPSNTAVSGVTVVATLMPSPAFRVSDNSEIAPRITTTSDVNGSWTLALERQANITPTGSWWEIEEQIPDADGGPQVWAISVGASNSTLQAARVTPTTDTALASYITQAAGDARYQSIGAGASNLHVISLADYATADWNGSTGTNNAAGIAAAIAAAGEGGTLVVPDADGLAYMTQSPILAEDLRGLTILGSSGQYGHSGSRIVGKHTGKAVLSLVGSHDCHVTDISLEGHASTTPKTGLLLGRSSSASAGLHLFDGVRVGGSFSVAGIYNIASESNLFNNCFCHPAVAPKASLYLCQADTYSVGGLTGSSMEHNVFVGGEYGSDDATAGAVGIFLDCGGSTGHNHWYGSFIGKNDGTAFVKIRLGNVDGLDTVMPNGFHDCFGEGNPTQGLYLDANNPNQKMWNFTFRARLQTPGTRVVHTVATTAHLIDADIDIGYNASTTPAVFNRLDNSRVSLLAASTVSVETSRSTEYLVPSEAAVPAITDGLGDTVHVLSSSLNRYPAFSQPQYVPTYGVSVAINASLATTFRVTATNNSNFTVANPTAVIAPGQRVTIVIINSSGGALGAITWDTQYKLAAWTNPANGTSRAITFEWNGTYWFETSRNTADVPN